MTDARAIAAQLVDIRNVGTHKVVKLTIHAPEEQAMKIMELFGWPTGVNPIPVALARLEKPLPPHPAEAAPRPVHAAPQPLPVGENKSRRPFTELSPAQQAGMLCNEQAFAKFLQEKHYRVWMRCDDLNDQRRCANVVRELCKVDSRAEIKPDNADWSALVLAYRLWQRHPELSPA